MSGDFNSGSGNSPWIGSESRRVVCPACSHIVVMDSGTSGGVMCPRCLGMVPANAPDAPPLAAATLPTATTSSPPPVVPSTPMPLKSPPTPVSNVAEANQVSGKVAGKGWIILVIALALGACCLPCGGVAIIASVLMSRIEPVIERQPETMPVETFTEEELDLQPAVDDDLNDREDSASVQLDSDQGQATYLGWQKMREIDNANDTPGAPFWEVIAVRYDEIDLKNVDPQFATLVQNWKQHATNVQQAVRECALEIQSLDFADRPQIEAAEAQRIAEAYLTLKGQGLPAEFEDRILAQFEGLGEQRQVYIDLEETTAQELTERYGAEFQ